MASQVSRIQKFLQGFNQDINVHLLNISPGVLIRRYVQDNKVKFKSYDISLLPKDYLEIKNLVKKRLPSLLNATYLEEEALFLLVSPFYADLIKDYKEEMFLISIGDSLPATISPKLKLVSFEEGLNKINDDLNYLVLITENGKILDKKVFYCDRYKEHTDALNNATFSQFLSLIKTEEIKDETTLISCLIKEGIPLKAQEKYLDFWYEYNEFLNIIDELCYEIERQKIDFIEGLENINPKHLKNSLIKHLRYNVAQALELLDSIK